MALRARSALVLGVFVLLLAVLAVGGVTTSQARGATPYTVPGASAPDTTCEQGLLETPSSNMPDVHQFYGVDCTNPGDI